MLDEYGFEIYEENEIPLAYLLTFRTYGTWLHGDQRHSVDRHGKNIYGTSNIAANERLKEKMESELKHPAFILNDVQRITVEAAVREVCEYRKYHLQAVNVRTNHVHAVISAQIKPDKIVDALKAYSTRRLREKKLVSAELKIWSRGKSGRYLWKPRHVAAAVDYTLYGQGDAPFEI